MLDNSELEQLNKAWPIVLMIWSAGLIFLGICLGLFHLAEIKQVETQIKITFSRDFTFEKLRSILIGVSFLTVFATHYVRKAMMKVVYVNTDFTASSQYHYHHSAFEKYLRAIFISTALSESIGIYGLVLFLLGKDWSSLYFLIIVSAIAMYYFRPKKQELLDLATEMTVKQFQNNLTPSKGQR